MTVKLPGSAAVPETPAPAGAPSLGTAPNGVAVLYTSPAPSASEPPFAPIPVSVTPTQTVPLNGASPVPYANGQVFTDSSHPSPQYPTITGSENGSISSSGHFIPPPSQYLPPGIGMTQNGEYYNLASGAPVDFRPAQPFYPTHPRSFPAQQRQFFPPQSYSPDLYAHRQRNSFSSPQGAFFPAQNGYPDARAGSPFANPYTQAQLGGYFAPARPTQKVSIRAPTANGTDEAAASPHKSAAAGMYPSIQPQAQQEYYPQHYNPYAANGMAMQMPVTNGEDGMYYDAAGYGYPQVQQYGQVPAAHGYEGEYPGY